MKKILSALIVFIMVFTTIMPAFAEGQTSSKLDLKQAIEIAKEKLGIKTEGYDFTSSYSEEQDGRKVWYLNWQGKNGKTDYINTSVDAETGDVTSYYSYSNNDNYSVIPKYSREEAKKAAAAFAQKVAPEKFKETELLDQNELINKQTIYYSDTYNFTYTRMINGIPFIDDQIVISIERNTLKVRNYTLSWDDQDLIDPSKAISVEEAEKVFKDKLGVELSYNLIYGNYNAVPKAMLVYTYVNGNKPIDALTGEVINYSNYYPYYGLNETKAMSSKSDNVKLTPEEDKNVEDTSKLITKEKALEIANKFLKIDSRYKLSYSSLNSGYPKGSNPVWNFSWDYSSKDYTDNGYKNITIDAATGELKSMYQGGSDFTPGKDEKVKYSKDDTKKIAEEFLTKNQPEKFKSMISRDVLNNYVQDAGGNYTFNYIRKVDGITYSFDTFNITVNGYTGDVTSFNMEWYEPTLPEAKDTISLEEAYKIFFEKQSFSLKYIKYTDYTKTTPSKPEVKLVYTMDNLSNMIDAKTGDLLDYNGNPLKLDDEIIFKDVKGYGGENEIYLLADMNIISDKEGYFKPNDEIKQKDFIKMLMKTVNSNYGATDSEENYDSYYQQALEKKVIFEKERSDDSVVTRISAAKFFVRAMNLGYIAKIKGIYGDSIKDMVSDSENIGYASVASGLNLIRTANGYYYPEKKLTRGESAVIIVRYLKLDTSNKE